MSKFMFSQRFIIYFGLALLAIVLVVVLYDSRQQTLHTEELHIMTQTRLIARNMEYQFTVTNKALLGIVDDIRFLKKPENHERSNARLRVLSNALPGIRTIFYTDADGTILSSNHTELIGRNFKHREYFTEPLKHRNTSILYISKPFKSVLGNYLFNITRIIVSADGRFDGVVTAAIDPEYFRVLLESVLYAPDMFASINHGDGIRFMTIPYIEGQAGKNLASPGSMFSRHINSKNQENIFTAIGYATDEYRMMALVSLNTKAVKLDKAPCIIAGRKVSSILSSWNNKVLVSSVFFLLVCVASIMSLSRTERQRALLKTTKDQLDETRQKYEDFFDFMPDPTLVVDADKKIIGWNRAIEEMTGVPKEEILGRGDNSHTIPFYGIRRPNLLDLMFKDDDVLKSTYPTAERVGEKIVAEAFCPALYHGKGAYVWAVVAPLFDSQGAIVGGIESIRDISHIKQLETSLKESNELLASQARIDFLTGIYNRLMFNELLQSELARACRYKTPVSLIMFDLDHFKQINDIHGHSIGDHVLKETACIVSDRIRAHDIFCRWGGEEFLILAPKNDADQAVQLAEILRVLVEQHDFGDKLSVTASFGVTCHICGEPPEVLLERADKAMYCAKNNGRNRVVIS